MNKKSQRRTDIMTDARLRCIGYGPHEGKCENEAGTPWGPHWCMRCDKIRLATISKNLEDMVNRSRERGEG